MSTQFDSKAASHNFDDETLEAVRSLVERSLQQCLDHWKFAASLPEFGYVSGGRNRLERNVTLPSRVARTRKEVVKQVGHIGDGSRFFQRQCHLQTGASSVAQRSE